MNIRRLMTVRVKVVVIVKRDMLDAAAFKLLRTVEYLTQMESEYNLFIFRISDFGFRIANLKASQSNLTMQELGTAECDRFAQSCNSQPDTQNPKFAIRH